MAGSSVHWGSAAKNFLSSTAQIIASVAVAAVGLWAINYVAPETSAQVVEWAKDFWKNGIPQLWDQTTEFLGSMWRDLNSPGGLVTQAKGFAAEQWQNPWVKGAAGVAAVGVGAYVAGSAIDSWQARVGKRDAAPSTYEMKEIARRLRAAQSTGERTA